ncbi:MAG TPA: cell division protein FtsH, partial [Candidatus Atribacteria bacterium]|nr:cell division protein FtsH [Candidatus Atribacteria bacterium]
MNKPNNGKSFKSIGLYLLLGIILISILTSFLEPQQDSNVKKLSYSEFLSHLEHNRIRRVIITNDTLMGIFEDGNKFVTYIPNDPDLIKILKQKEVDIEVKPPAEPSWWLRFLTSLFPTLLFIAFWIIWFQQMQGGGGKVMSFAKSKAKLVSGEKKKVT